MSQEDIILYLKNLRILGDNEFYSIKQIALSLDSPYITTWQKVNKLYAWGYLEIKVVDWKRSFRAKTEE